MTTAMALSLNSYEVKKEMKEAVHKRNLDNDNITYIGIKHLGDNCVSEIVYKFLESVNDNKTKIAYETDIKQFFNWIGLEITDVTLSDLNNVKYSLAVNYKKYLVGKYASMTARRKKNTMQTLFTFIRKDLQSIFDVDMFNDNPFAGIEIKDTDSKTYGDYSETEIKQIIKNSYRSEDQLAILIAITTGLRINEILNLNINNSFERLNNGIMCMVGRGKHNVEFLKGITNDLYLKCVDVASINDNDGYLFKGMQGMTSGAILKRLQTTLRYIGVTDEIRKQRALCFHSFRKCTASLVYDITGGNMRAIQEAMGHESIKTTEKHYVVIDKKSRMKDNMGEAIERKLFGNSDVESDLSDALSGLSVAEIGDRLMNGLNESEICKIIDALQK